MRNYLTYNAVELAQDHQFQLWVKYPGANPENDLFWENWQRENPRKADDVREARSLVLAVMAEGDILLDKEKEDEILGRIKSWNRQVSVADVGGRRKSHAYIFRIAAVVLALMVAAGGLWWMSPAPRDEAANKTHSEGTYVKEINNSDQRRRLVLEDGTAIVLGPKSALQYPAVFGKDFREVRLSGEGFFDVAKDPNRPFTVYAQSLVTRVLGTSFNIRAFEEDDTLLVQVSSGRVSVFVETEAGKEEANGNAMDGLILTPNQQVVFVKNEARMSKTLVDNPALLESKSGQRFVFEDRPLREVFALLQDAYGIEIVFDDEILGGCKLNASLDGLSLYDKIRLVCKGINAQYQILDSRIVVSGKGCREWGG